MCKKMNLVVCDYDDKLVNSNADGFIFNSKEFSCYPSKTMTSTELINLFPRKSKKKYLLNIDSIIEEDEIDTLKKYLQTFFPLFDYIIYSDYAVLLLITQMFGDSAKDKLIYDSKTLVCSSKEASMIDTKTFISSELSYDEVENILANSSDGKIAINVCGFHRIMYSKRPLLSLYNDFSKESILSRNQMYDLKEEIRSEKYKIIETEKGTFIYTPYAFYFKKPLSDIKRKVFMLRISNPIIDQKSLSKYGDLRLLEELIDLYKDYFEGREVNIDNSLIDFKEGFLTEKLYLLKGARSDE